MAIDVKSSESVNQAANQAQEQRKSDQEINFAALRKKTEALEAELQKRDQMMQQQHQMIQQLQNRFPDQRDELDSLPDDELLDKAKFKRLIEKERSSMRKEAEEVARQTYQKIDSENYQHKLYSAFPDYDQVVNNANAEKLQEKDPEFMSLLAEVKDEYKRREMAYKKMKKLAQAEEDARVKVKAQDVVNENRQTGSNFYSPGGQGPSANPYAFEFDVKSPEARKKAYERLKAGQKRVY
jgi:hypothetical protein